MIRIETLRLKAFHEGEMDGYLVFNSINQLYFTGVPGTAALLVPKEGESTLYVYNVNYEQVKAQAKTFRVELVNLKENLLERIAKRSRELGIRNLCIDSINVEGWNRLTKETKETTLKIDNNPVKEMRAVKDQQEIRLLKRAGELTSEGMKAARESLRPGVKEYEVAAEIEYAMRKKGSSGTAFETSVASGARSAFPHGGCTNREIREGDIVIVDLGATYMNYCSDMTRTLVAGKPSGKQNKIAKIVEEAQEDAFKTITPGVPSRTVDEAARKTIEASGYGNFFVHGLGHGVGLEIHEPPTLNNASMDILLEGNVVTDEPGIYMVGYGGFRMEDTVLVEKTRPKRLTQGSYSLTE
jgi:Xaa-Pro aminopeptidase